jgi:hypothetical protein
MKKMTISPTVIFTKFKNLFNDTNNKFIELERDGYTEKTKEEYI